MSFSIVEGDVVIRDSSGNPIGVILDGAVYRFAVDAKVTASVLPTGAATEATVSTLLTEAEFQARINTQGQKASSASTPVVLASDQSSIPVTDDGGSLTIDNANLDAALSTLATEATATTLLTEAEFEARIGTLGQKTMAGSTPVVLASDQSRVLVEATIANAAGLVADTVTQGTRTAQAIEYPALLAMTKQVLDELRAIRLHLEQINEETDPL